MTGASPSLEARIAADVKDDLVKYTDDAISAIKAELARKAAAEAQMDEQTSRRRLEIHVAIIVAGCICGVMMGFFLPAIGVSLFEGVPPVAQEILDRLLNM